VSQSILISHLLLVTISCKRNLGLRLGFCNLPRERWRRQRGEATEGNKEKRYYQAPSVQQKEITPCKNSTIPQESALVFLL